MIETGFTEMHLAINHAGQNMQAFAINDLTGGRARQITKRCDLSILDAHITLALAILVDNDPVFENAIEGLGHGFTPPLEV